MGRNIIDTYNIACYTIWYNHLDVYKFYLFFDERLRMLSLIMIITNMEERVLKESSYLQTAYNIHFRISRNVVLLFLD